MKEASLRKFHRILGVSISIFVLIQVITGLLLSIDRIAGTTLSGNAGMFLHLGDGIFGNEYRILLAFALVTLVATGWWIFLKILSRTASAQKRAAGPAKK